MTPARRSVIALQLPWAARAQVDVRAIDYVMSARAAIARPGAVWWWGRRPVAGRSYAVCYLCDHELTGWSGTTRIPAIARAHVIRHRDYHMNDYHPTSGNDTAGTLPAGAAPGQEADR